MNQLLRLHQLVPGSFGWVVRGALLLACITASYVAQAMLTAQLLAALLEGARLSALVPRLGAILVLVALRAGCHVLRAQSAALAGASVVDALRQALASKLLALGPGWTRARRAGELQSLLRDGAESAEPLVARFLPQLLVTTLSATALSAYVLRLDALVGAIVLSCALGAPLVPIASWRLIREATERWQVHYRGLYAENLDAIQGMTTLKLFGASRARGRELAERAQRFSELSTRVIALWGPYLGIMALLAALGSSLAVGLGALHHAEGALGATELLTLLLLTRECFRPVKDLEDAYHDSLAFRAYAGELFELLDSAPASPLQAVPAVDAAVPLPRAMSLAFEEVRFWYDDPARPALAGLTLHVAPGERVGIVGKSGAGKSTLVALLLRFFDPQAGRVLIGGRDARELPIAELRAQIALVSQDTYLFHGTIRENLLLARPQATQEELEAAALAARIHSFIAGLPDGYDTPLGERGLTLSGGERQRLSIARALLKDAPILVLDEATSHLDSVHEAGIQAALAELTTGRLTLVIAHRLSTVRELDRIVVMEGGRIVEQGRHEELMRRRGAYYAQAVRPASTARLEELSA